LTSSSVLSYRMRHRAAGWVSFGQNISGRRYSALKALIFLHNKSTFIRKKTVTAFLSPLWKTCGQIRCSY